MKRFKYIFFVFSLLLLNIYMPVNSLTNSVSKVSAQEIDILLDSVGSKYDIPEVSSQVENLPWKNDLDFLKAKDKHQTPILMAAYCAVLKNPLPGESYNVGLASSKLKGHVLRPGQNFSMNSLLGPYSKSQGYREGASYSSGNVVMTTGGGVCKIAGLAYNLAILTDLEILERHHHSMPINYIPYGQDATVFYGTKDLQFKNTGKHKILIWSQMIGNRLYMAFYGSERPPEIEWNHEISNITEPSIKYIKNPNLPKGQMVTITEGLQGASVKSTIVKKYKDGSKEIKNMGISNYIALPKIIETN